MSELSPTDIKRLTQEIEQRRKELDEDLRALNRVQKMLGHGKNGAVKTEISHRGNEDYSDAGFNESVRIAARNSGGVEFTVAMVEATLQKQGVKLPAVNPRKRISTVLKEMCANKSLMLVKEGSGKVPHLYRIP